MMMIAVVWLWAGVQVAQATLLEDLTLTQKIVLTLANSLSPDYQSTPNDMSRLMERVAEGEIFVDEEGEAGQGTGTFAYPFQTGIGGEVRSGYLRIASPHRHPELETEQGWRALAEETGTGAKVWFRKVETPAVTYNEVEASLAQGAFVLTVSERRPVEESPAEARTAILKRFDVLLENARRYGLLSDITVELVDGDSDEKGIALSNNDLVNIRGRDTQETSARFRICATDSSGRPLPNVDYYSIQLKGFLARHASVRGAIFNAEKNRYEVHDPPSTGALVDLSFPALKDEEFARDLKQDSRMASDFGIVLEVEAAFKPEIKE
jgi:hypothetical protein